MSKDSLPPVTRCTANENSQRPFSLLYVSPQFPALSLVFEQNEILGLIEEEINVTVYSCRKPSVEDIERIHDFVKPIQDVTIYSSLPKESSIQFLRMFGQNLNTLHTILGNCLRAATNPLALPKTMAAGYLALSCYQQVKGHVFDWIHADFGQGSATVALLLSRLLGIPFSFKVHAFDIFDKRLRFKCPLFQEKLRCAGLVFSEHRFGAAVLRSKFHVDSSKVAVNYSSIRPMQRVEKTSSTELMKFVALGRLVPKKGFHVLLEACSLLLQKVGPCFTLSIYGDGPMRSKLIRLTARLQLSNIVSFCGSYQNEHLPNILSESAAIVVPSVMDKHGDMDGVPTVIYESMALQTPVIASSISGIPEVVVDRVTGLLVKPNDPRELAQKMVLVMEDRALMAKLAGNAFKYVSKEHDYRRNASALADHMINHLQADSKHCPGQG